MKRASISEAKNNLSALLDRVKGGTAVLIVDRGTPVARLEPVRPADITADERIDGLVRAGLVRPPRKRLPPDFFDRPLPKPRKGVSAVQVLLEDRRSGR